MYSSYMYRMLYIVQIYLQMTQPQVEMKTTFPQDKKLNVDAYGLRVLKGVFNTF